MIDTLKSICDQCIQISNPRLDFLSFESARHREIILRDVRELVSAASRENEKTVVILTGSIIESVLYGFIRNQQKYISWRRGAPFRFDSNHGLRNYVDIFNCYFRQAIPSVLLPDSLVRYRDLVHINRELNPPPDICVQASREMLRMLALLLEGLGDFSDSSTPAQPGLEVLIFLRRMLKAICDGLKRV